MSYLDEILEKMGLREPVVRPLAEEEPQFSIEDLEKKKEEVKEFFKEKVGGAFGPIKGEGPGTEKIEGLVDPEAAVRLEKGVPPRQEVQQKGMSYESPEKEKVVSLINKTFPEDPATARAIFTHESQLGSFFESSQGTPDYGVAQINLPLWREHVPGETDEEKIEALKDPETNLKVARIIYDDAVERWGNGFIPWVSYTSGAYKDYLDGV